MKVLGKIQNVVLGFQQPKSHEDGSQYWGEKYNVQIESGDDVFIVDSGWVHCQGQNGGLEILKRRGIEVGAEGKATIRFGVREYNGRQFPNVTLERFESYTKNESAKPAEVTELIPTAAETEQSGDLFI